VEASAAYGLALLQQGKPDEALAVMASLPAGLQGEPRAALYRGFFLASAGRVDEARAQLDLGAPAVRYAAEKSLLEMLRFAFTAMAGNDAGSEAAWGRALAIAAGHPERLEMLARLAQSAGAARFAEATLWKLAADERCPRWVLDSLWASAQKDGTSEQRYRLSKLLVKADPKSIAARNQSILLGLLTHQEVDAPHRQAEALYKQYVAEPGVASTYALSLYQQERTDEALKLLEGLPPSQLREAHTAFIYGVILAASGQPQKAAEPLRAGLAGPIFPEERQLVEKVATDEALKPLLSERAQSSQ
jgi:predicted negative regulator of RcsB-dependent stress response